MRKATISFCAAVLLIACDSQTKPANEVSKEAKVAGVTSDNKEEPWKTVDTATANKRWMEYMTPGQEHAMLAKGTGKWSAEMTSWMEAGATPTTEKGMANTKMLLGGRYQQMEYKGQFWGMPFEGISTTAYDNSEKKYITTWMDNMGTGVMEMKGTWNEANKSIDFAGKMTCVANGQECNVREVYKIIDDKHHVMEMYGPDMKTGKEYKNMEVKFTKL